MSAPEAFIDTNILVYALDTTAGEKHRAALGLVQRLWAEGSGCLSVQVLQEFHVTVTRKVGNPLPRDVSERLVEAFSFWRVHSPTPSDVRAAISIQGEFEMSFWDSMILASAISLGCDRLLSEDFVSGRRYRGVLVENPLT